MPRFRAKMRHIDLGCGIIGQHAQTLPRFELLQPFAGAQHGQGAQKPTGVDVVINLHTRHIGGMFQNVHTDVTTALDDAGRNRG